MLKRGLLEPEAVVESTVGRVKADVAHGSGVERTAISNPDTEGERGYEGCGERERGDERTGLEHQLYQAP